MKMVNIAGYLLFGLAATAAAAEETENTGVHPVFGRHQSSNLSAEAEVTDIPKLEAKAVQILRKTERITAAEARAKLRVDGKTDVQRCLDYVIIDQLTKITLAKVVVTTVHAEHPQPTEQPQ